VSCDVDGRDAVAPSLNDTNSYSQHNVLPACFETIVESDSEPWSGLVDACQNTSISDHRRMDKRSSKPRSSVSEDGVSISSLANVPLDSNDIDSSEDDSDANSPTSKISMTIRGALDAVKSRFVSDVMSSIAAAETPSMPILPRQFTTSSNTNSSEATSSHGTSMTSRSSFNSSRSGGRKRADADDGDGDDLKEHNDGRRGRQKRARSTPLNLDTNRKLACPFHQRDPQQHQKTACTGPGWSTIVRLKYVRC
jgi:hypothetical protein